LVGNCARIHRGFVKDNVEFRVYENRKSDYTAGVKAGVD
jgi:hypothetical protein